MISSHIMDTTSETGTASETLSLKAAHKPEAKISAKEIPATEVVTATLKEPRPKFRNKAHRQNRSINGCINFIKLQAKKSSGRMKPQEALFPQQAGIPSSEGISGEVKVPG